jgi:hypothetical protein
MDSNTQIKKERPVPLVVHHDEFTESYYLHVINLYRSRVNDEATHRSICEKTNDRLYSRRTWSTVTRTA